MAVSSASQDNINQAVRVSRLAGYTGSFKELGGGEVNETFVLDCGPDKVVLRISRYDTTKTLHQEARALRLLNLEKVPKLIFFDEGSRIDGRLWIIESYIEGSPAELLDAKQYCSLGRLLAQVHKVRQGDEAEINFWEYFLDVSKSFGNERSLLSHPDTRLKQLINKGHSYLQSQKSQFSPIAKSLIHGDATPSNVLVDGDEVSLIDWEFSTFKDPMSDFSTIYYEDIDYNKGKWRVKITQQNRDALFDGYKDAGGALDEQRIQVWMNLDKLGAAVYLYWKLHESGHSIDEKTIRQYQLDLNNLMGSLERNLP